MTLAPLTNLRVLVVEDEMLVSLIIEDVLAEQGCTLVGPASKISQALQLARSEALDFAILDVNIAGEKVYPVAEVLAARRIPFLFLSGYGENAVPRNHPDWRVCSKPFRSEELVAMMREQVSPGTEQQVGRTGSGQ